MSGYVLGGFAAATQVVASEAFAAHDILVSTGVSSGVPSVHKALPDNLNRCRGTFFVADAAAVLSATSTVLQRKLVTGVDTSGKNVGDPVYLDTTAGKVTLTLPGVTADDAAFSLMMIVGRVLNIHAATGSYILDPQGLQGSPLMGRVAAGGGTSTLVTGFGGYTGFPCGAWNNHNPMPADDDQIKAVHITGAGKLQITFDHASANYSPITYAIYI
jgi:hypothetical protein